MNKQIKNKIKHIRQLERICFDKDIILNEPTSDKISRNNIIKKMKKQCNI